MNNLERLNKIKPEAIPGPTSTRVEESPRFLHNSVVKTPVRDTSSVSFSVREKPKAKRVIRGANAAARTDHATTTRLKTLAPP